ncbi:protein phosphatase 2C domain-containing protein [Micromonospora echinofusca]|uniref:SpoIIE family protein phosphatase n=1 Tax=Micromonospora echinofusca TaxID=47858 RepID=A0ABS3VV87_MICEH|nr:protein phosphatase 2C domain-containing protein [Micromonospora echinofusca]MBO4208461.1 SpoIIE family protein phosphatase [Micromonospora echinofusca]
MSRPVAVALLLLVLATVGTALLLARSWWVGPVPVPATRRRVVRAAARLADVLPGRVRSRHPGPATETPPPPLTRALVLTPRQVPVGEPPLATAVIGCRSGSATFHGGCGSGPNRLTVRAATLRGLAHALDGGDGQDAVGARWDRRAGALHLAVADGLGSLPGSATAAMVAVQEALRSMRDSGGQSSGPPFSSLFTRAGQAVAAQATTARGELHGATTLVVAEVRPAERGAVVRCGGIGDSEAWVLDEHGWWAAHHERDSATENATRQLPRHAQPRLAEVAVRPGSVLLLATDGFAAALGGRRSRLGETLAARWRRPPSPLEFLAQVDFVDDYHTDDRTVVAVWIG